MSVVESDITPHSPADPGQVACLQASAWIEHHQLRINTHGPVPDFLLQANSAFMVGNTTEALSLLCEENLDIVREIVSCHAHRVDLMYMLAKLFSDLREFDQAEHWCRKVIEREPSAVAFFQLAHVLSHSLVNMSEGVKWARRAVELDPDNRLYLVQLGKGLFSTGRVEQGLNVLEQTAGRFPDDPELLAGLLWRRHCLPGVCREDFLDGYLRWGQLITGKVGSGRHHENNPDPGRRLRVGFISPDFCRNSAAYTFEPFLDGRDREQMEIFGYANNMQSDRTTDRLRTAFDRFRPIFGMAPEQVVALIQQDQIDILVEIGGHTRGHSLEVLAHKPAPIQVDLGGYNTTGLPQVDYRITDKLLDPPNWSQPYVETNVYLPGGYFSYRPDESPPQVSPLPARQNGYVTFAAFHGRHKLNELTLTLWGSILRQVENARLLLKLGLASDKGVVDHLLKQCEKCNLDPDRVEILGRQGKSEHLALYERVDMALDAYPFNAALTALEALWMGVPLVSLSGPTWISRAGRTIMHRLGLDVFVASDREEYVAKAVAFSRQLDELALIRQGLRQLMLNSPLCSAERFAGELGAAFRQMWVAWCKANPAEQLL